MSLANKVEQFDIDSDLVNAWVHGGVNDTIITDSGIVSSPAKLIADKETEINLAAQNLPLFGNSAGSSLVGYIHSGTGATATTVQTKLREIVSVKDFGAVGNGSIDDTATIQAAIDYITARNGGMVFLPSGIYRVRDLNLKSRVVMKGSGIAATKLRFQPSGNEANDSTSYVINWTGAFAALSDLTIDGQNGGPYSVGNGLLIAQGTDNTYTRTLKNVRVEFFAGYKASPAGGTYGLREEYAADDIRNAGTGVFNLVGGNAIYVSDNEGTASNLLVDTVFINRCDGYGFYAGRANDSKFSNIQVSACIHGGFINNRSNKNNQFTNIKVYQCCRLNISESGATGDETPIAPLYGNTTTDGYGAVVLTGANHSGNIEAQENGSHGFLLGISNAGLFNCTLDLTADGNGGYITGDALNDTDYRRYGVRLRNYYNLHIRLNADDLRSKFAAPRQLYGIYASAPYEYTATTNMNVGDFYYIADNTGATFTTLQLTPDTPSNAVGTIFQAQATIASPTLVATFGSGMLESVNDGLHLTAVISNQLDQDAGGIGYVLDEDRGLTSSIVINGVTQAAEIEFPASIGTGTATSNSLIAYEEGTFTPVVSDAASAGNNATAVTSLGFYTRVGNTVHCTVTFVDINTTGLTAGNQVHVTGLPFTSKNTTNRRVVVPVLLASVTLTTGGTFGRIAPNTTAIPLFESLTTGAAALTVSALTSGSADLWATFTYQV